MMTSEQLQAHFLDEIKRWFADQGDQTHRLNYNLNESSVVVDLGGYEGKWADNVYSKYNCTVHVFEPVESFCNGIRSRFNGNPKIIVHQSALGHVPGEATITMSADGSSMFGEGADKVPIKIESVHDFLSSVSKVDLVKINIEGGEYDLLDCLSESELSKIANIQVQFHTFYPNCQERRNAIREKLSKTHTITYNYDFVWENWKLKQ